MGSVLIRSAIANNVLQYIAIHCQFVLAKNTMCVLQTIYKSVLVLQ
jgi:hypothetical protein